MLVAAACGGTAPLDSSTGDDDDDDTAGSGASGGSNNHGYSGGPGAGGAGAGVDWGQSAEPRGSFDVRFLEIAAEKGDGPRLDRSPSFERLVRVDFPETCGAVAGVDTDPTPCVLRPDWAGKVLVTVQGGAPTAYDVRLQDRLLILETKESQALVEGFAPSAGGASGAGGAPAAYFTSDAWSRFAFQLDARNQVVPPVQAQALQLVYIGDGVQAFPVDLSARASFHADRTPPTASIAVGSSFSPPGAQFPWDPLTVAFDEPVVLSPGEAVVATAADLSEIAPLVWRWSAEGAEGPPDYLAEAFGAVAYRGYWRGWDASPLESTVRLGAFRDPRGNPGAGVEAGLSLRLPAPHASPAQGFELAEPGAKMVLWGDAARVGAGCESGGCVAFTFDNVECGLTGASGVAFRLEAPAGADPSKLRLKARMRVDVANEGGAPGGNLQHASLQIVRAGSEAPDVKEVQVVDTGRWVDVVKELEPPTEIVPPSLPPANPRDLAIVLRSGARYATQPCRKAAPAPLQTRISIDSILVEETPPPLPR